MNTFLRVERFSCIGTDPFAAAQSRAGTALIWSKEACALLEGLELQVCSDAVTSQHCHCVSAANCMRLTNASPCLCPGYGEVVNRTERDVCSKSSVHISVPEKWQSESASVRNRSGIGMSRVLCTYMPCFVSEHQWCLQTLTREVDSRLAR